MTTPHIQASLADIIVAVDPGLPESGVVMQTHDEVVFEHGDTYGVPAGESAFFARRLERISQTMMEMDFSQQEARIMEAYIPRMGRGIYCGNPGPDIRLGSRKISRDLLSKIGHRYARTIGPTGTPRKVSGNMRDVRRWLRQKLAPVAAVAGDALELGQRGRAIAILCEVVHYEDAISIVGGPSRRVYPSPQFETGRASYGAEVQAYPQQRLDDMIDAARSWMMGHTHRTQPYPAADIAAALIPRNVK